MARTRGQRWRSAWSGVRLAASGDGEEASTSESGAAVQSILDEAERAGLRLAIKGRLIALAALALWFVVSRSSDPERVLGFIAVITVFAGLGVLHYSLIGSRHDRSWLKYLFLTLDLALLSALMATQPMYDSADLPQAMNFRNPVFPYYFVVLAVSAFSFSPGLVLWTGLVGVAGWLGAFAWSIRDMPLLLDWTDVPPKPSAEEFLGVFFRPEFVGTGSRIQEAVAYFVVAVLVAIVTVRARRTVRRQAELDRERAAISEVFGRYVPKAIADVLINDNKALAPIEREATILFADIANFTAMTEENGAQRTMRMLNAYFEAVTRIISERAGIVTQFQGDAVLATFNVPVPDAGHARKAIDAALAICTLTHSRQFEGNHIRARIGVCTGTVVAGSVGGGGRESYTVHGNTVNLAARLEVLNKTLETEILVAGSTLAQAEVSGFERVGEIAVRGLRDPVHVFTPTSGKPGTAGAAGSDSSATPTTGSSQ